MLIKLDTAAGFPFSTRDPTTGASADADSLPTAVVETAAGSNVAGTDIAVTKKAATTGQYTVTLTTANAQFTVGEIYVIRVTATVTGVTDQAPIQQFEVSAGVHGKVIGEGVPEGTAGQPDGLLVLGANTLGANTMSITSTGGDALQLVGGAASNGDGLHIMGQGTGNGLRAEALGSGRGITVRRGMNILHDQTATAFVIQADDGDGMTVVGTTNDIVADITGSVGSVADPASIWAHTDTESATKTAFQVICMAAAGAGAGTVDVSIPAGVTRNETTRYLDGSDAYITAADENGNRTLVNLNP